MSVSRDENYSLAVLIRIHKNDISTWLTRIRRQATKILLIPIKQALLSHPFDLSMIEFLLLAFSSNYLMSPVHMT